MLIALDDLSAPIDFGDADALVPVFKRVLRGWTVREMPDGDPSGARIRLNVGARGYERRSPWIEGGGVAIYPDPVDAVCDLLLDVERAYIEDAPVRGDATTLVLHAAAVEMGHGDDRGLVVFPSTHETGKSLLTAALAGAGQRVFADDLLPLRPGSPAFGVAPGFLPRLRRPLPAALDDALAAFIRGHAGPMSDRFRYLNLDGDRLAPLGATAPIKGVVLLQRSTGATPALTAAGEAEVLKACVLQGFGRTVGALEILDHLHALVQGAKCVKVAYGDAPEAVALLQEAFA